MGIAQEPPPRAPAVHRAVRLVDALAFERRARPADLARAIGLPKSSASDLIGTLLEERMLARSGEDLVLGRAFLDLAAGFVGRQGMLRDFGIGWERSRALREHTVTLQALIGAHSVCVGVRLGSAVLPYTPRAGSRLPLWSDGAPEPVLRVVDPDDVFRTLEAFPEASSADPRTPPGAWPDGPAPSATGNLELNALVSAGADRGGPVVATVHLPPGTDASPRLPAALRAFARDLHDG